MLRRIELLRIGLSLGLMSLVTGCDFSMSPAPSDTTPAKKMPDAAPGKTVKTLGTIY